MLCNILLFYQTSSYNWINRYVFKDTKKPSEANEKNKIQLDGKINLLFSLMKLILLCASVFVSRPTGLRSSNVTFTSVRVDWNPVPERFIIGYRVFVQGIPLNETRPWKKTSALVAGLRSNTMYVITVLPVHGLTDEKQPSGNAASIIVTTKREPGKRLGRVCSSRIKERCFSSFHEFGTKKKF